MALWMLKVVLYVAISSIRYTFAKVMRSDIDLFNEMIQELPHAECDFLMINSPVQGKLGAYCSNITHTSLHCR